jgi:hypothetical protein
MLPWKRVGASDLAPTPAVLGSTRQYPRQQRSSPTKALTYRAATNGAAHSLSSAGRTCQLGRCIYTNAVHWGSGRQQPASVALHTPAAIICVCVWRGGLETCEADAPPQVGLPAQIRWRCSQHQDAHSRCSADTRCPCAAIPEMRHQLTNICRECCRLPTLRRSGSCCLCIACTHRLVQGA